MNAKKYTILFVLFVLFALILSACAAATPQSMVKTIVVEKEGQTVIQTVEVEKVVVVEEASQVVVATQASSNEPSGYYAWPTATPGIAIPGTVPTPVDNYFQNYGVNPYVDAYEDHLSTFALDVDTASYSVMRRYLQDGNLPPADAIRVEEFVNYFDPGYPTPPDIAFGIYADGAPSPFANDGSYLLRFGVQGYVVPEWERKPAILTFVIDVSGSMQREQRLELVKQSLQILVDRLHSDDSVSIVVYGSDARVMLYPTAGSERDTILRAIYSLKTEGATNAEAGLILGYDLAMRAYRNGASNRVILCSDGVANVGATGPDEILSKVRGYVEEGVYLTTVGFGMGNFNDVLMEQLADNGNGSYAYVDDLDEAQKLFVEDLTATLQVIALDAKIQVDFNPNVVAYYRLIGYENRDVADQDFRNDAVDAGEIGAGHSATALYAVTFRPNADGRIATVQLRWEDPDTHQVTEINGNFNTWDLTPNFQEASPYYQLAVLAAQYAEVLRNSPWAYTTTLNQLSAMAQPLRYSILESGEVNEFIDLLARASQIWALGQ
ncbi:MAG: von Willebrand factor type A domain-containing protein [Anaerolineales bacterium]|nr:von Willebrand factor type A domain-containing protein [Anaerolineales bacterium]